MPYRNPFYNQIDDSLRKELNYRAQLYGAVYRATTEKGKGDLPIMWPYGKTAYAHIKTYAIKYDSTGTQKIRPLMTIGSSNGTGTYPLDGSDKRDTDFAKDLLQSNVNSVLYSPKQRNLPKHPVLESVSISNEGRVGSLQKASAKFKVYTPEQLAVVEEKVLTPGLGVTISYGWSVSTGPNSRTKFDGVVSNFDWSLNDDGTFSCTFEAVGKGFYGTGIPANATMKKEEGVATTPEDKSGFDLKATNLVTLIDKEIASLKKPSSNTIGSNGVIRDPKSKFTELGDGIGWCVISNDTDGDKIKTEGQSADVTESAKTPPEPRPVYYLTMNTLVNYFNSEIIAQSDRLKNSVKYVIFDKDYGSPGAKDPNVASCIPVEVLFSDFDPKGQSSYGDVHYKIGNGGEEVNINKLTVNDKAINLAYIWVSTDAIKEAFQKVTEDKSTQPELRSVNMFFDEIFKKIAYASGDVYQLGIFVDEDVEKGSQGIYWIYCKNWGESDADIVPYTFSRSIHRPLLRELNMSSKLPSKMQTQAYVGGRSGISDEPGRPPDTSEDRDKEGEDKIDSTDETIKKIQESRTNMGKLGFSEALKTQLNSLLRAYRANPNDDATWIKNNVYPIDLSITIDGIAGFRFGNVIRTDYLPKRYAKEMVFVITKIQHDVSNNDWTTTLEVQARLRKIA